MDDNNQGLSEAQFQKISRRTTATQVEKAEEQDKKDGKRINANREKLFLSKFRLTN